MEYTKGMGWDKNTNTKIAGEGGPLRSGEEEKWSGPQGMGESPERDGGAMTIRPL